MRVITKSGPAVRKHPGPWHEGKVPLMHANRNGCSGPATIEAKIRAIIRQDDTAGFVIAAEKRPSVEHLSDWERDLVDWGAVYGLAYGIARAENPFEPFEDVAARAFDAAWPVYLEWSGEFEYDQRDTNELVQNVVREYTRPRTTGRGSRAGSRHLRTR
jgi:hypothetical protein